jgi:predicted ABC-class ATPase
VNSTYILSENVVARKIEGETILVPITAGIGDLEEDLYTVNESGDAILSMLDGKRTLNDIVASLSSQYESDKEELRADVIGFTNELFRRKILVESS